jgi:hypothetical protein
MRPAGGFWHRAKNIVCSPLKNSFFVGDEVTSLKFPWFLKAKLETPYVVSYFLNRLSDKLLHAVRLLLACRLELADKAVRAPFWSRLRRAAPLRVGGFALKNLTAWMRLSFSV